MLPVRLYRTLLWCYPAPFREEYGAEMVSAFGAQVREARQQGGWWPETSVWLRTLTDLFRTASREHSHMIGQDVRYAFRTLASQPGFAAVAVLSLALGIGANTAIFSLLHSVLMSALPVRDPQGLVMLTDPASSGVGHGSQSNDRALLTHTEFEQLRDRTSVFSSLMAAQSQLERVSARVAGGVPEEIRYRLVSAEYFSTLGVPAWLGRAFSPADDRTAPLAVLSHQFWQRRLGGRPDVAGTRVAIHQGVFTVVGVMPASFFGETVGERPDLWLPLSLQPVVLPGRDWLHDQPGTVEKTMWLHVFGRLQPGTTLESAQSAANVVFQQGLAAHYGSALTPDRAKTFLNQRLRLRPAVTGASQLRGQVAEPLTLLQAAAGVVLLITCANLANLLLARATGRLRETSVRLALGAGRSQLIRQSLTESLVLAGLGGVAGMAAAWALRVGLLHLASGRVDLPLTADVRVLGFAFALTLLTGLILGLLPTLRMLGADTMAGLREQGRGLTGSSAWLRTSRSLVAGQLALSLPLVLAAALLVQTLLHLQHVNLGYPMDRLLMVDVDARTAGYPESSQFRLYQQVLALLQAVPGVRDATWSNNGLFTGSDSGDSVRVEGYTPTGQGDGNSRYEHVGPRYFSALGIPLLLGREITERDQSTGPKVCVINEAFAKRFFAGRNPLGLHVTQLFGNQRNTFEVVGVARDARSRSLRDAVEHRYYVPAAQPIFAQDSVTFAIRTVGEPSAILNAVRRAVLSINPNLPVTDARPLNQLVDERMAQDRLLARLSTAFGVVALLLAAIGLYGVLSYGVARRTNEIGIRKALGAPQGAVMAMILRETGVLLAVGLVAGIALSAAGGRLITSRLYGTVPTDPATLAGGVAVLAAVALLAAWLPARRASRVDPVIALRYE